MAENENGQEKSEAPSPKRREEAIEKGDVAKSQELNSVAIIIAVLIVFNYYSADFGETLRHFMTFMYSEMSNLTLNIKTVPELMELTLIALMKVTGPIILSIMAFAIISNLGQVGFIIATKALKPDFKKLSPASGIKRMFSTRSLVELAKGIIKIAIIASIGYSVISDYFDEILLLTHQSVMAIAELTANSILEVTFKVALALMVMAAADYAYQKYEHEKKLKMTKDEVKDERKQAEGDPKVKGKIKGKQQEIARARMMSEVPEATVVITNPTHYAVALKYDPFDKADAPKVIAKGKNIIAQNIKKIAREHNVPIVENKPLARSLFASCEIGMEVPVELYQAVAEILGQVYKENQDKFNKIKGSLNG